MTSDIIIIDAIMYNHYSILYYTVVFTQRSEIKYLKTQIRKKIKLL